MKEKNIKKIILAYSGGLDTSVIIPWLKENYNNCEVIAVVADVGQGSELDKIEEKAIKSGASKVYIENIKEEFVEEYIVPAIKAGAKYENKYLLGTALARPLIAKKLVEVAKKEKTNIICHGCTGKGNDQVRFELTIKAYMPNVQIIAPWRIWDIKSREEEFEYAKKHNIPLKITKETNYSKDKNIWHLSHEGLDLENPSNEPKYDEILEMGVSPEKALDNPTYIEISFEKGKPIALNGKNKTVIEIIKKLNKIGGENGIGIIDIVENRLVGMKSRGVYETPGGTILYKAHELLESICLDKDTMHYKINLSNDFAKQIYDGKWESLLTKSMISFIEKTQENVTGSVRLKLYKGNIIPAGIISEYSLYSEKIATFGEDDSYNQKDAEGFINLFGLSIKMTAEMESKLKGEE
ncbi:MAG TPA: argininosuccinate synthase [Candidatus Scatovivens faecipullorum]|nr:argininosuccinate synthase [Candidatus Scatovivens faecipullorum]